MEWKRSKNFLWLWKLLSLYLFVYACPSIHTPPVNTRFIAQLEPIPAVLTQLTSL